MFSSFSGMITPRWRPGAVAYNRLLYAVGGDEGIFNNEGAADTIEVSITHL